MGVALSWNMSYGDISQEIIKVKPIKSIAYNDCKLFCERIVEVLTCQEFFSPGRKASTQ